MQNQVHYEMQAAPSTTTNMMAQETAQEAAETARPKKVRTSFSSFQLMRLEETFKEMRVITRSVKNKLSLELNLQEKQIKIWFQNRRMKEKKENGKAAAAAAKDSRMKTIPTAVTVQSNQVYNTMQGQCHLNSPSNTPSCQYEVAPSPAASYYNSGYQNHNCIYQNKVVELPPAAEYCTISKPLLDPNLIHQSNMPQSSSFNPNLSLNNLPSAPSYISNSPPTLDQYLHY